MKYNKYPIFKNLLIKNKSIITEPSKIYNYLRFKCKSKRSFNKYKLSYNPVFIVLFITNKCNLNCRSCNYIDILNNNMEDMGLLVLKQILNNQFIKDGLGISLTGGEPLLNNDIINIVNYIKEKNFFVFLNTNGMLLEEWGQDLIKTKIDVISISLYDSNAGIIPNAILKYIGKKYLRLNKIVKKSEIGKIESVIKYAIANCFNSLMLINVLPRNKDNLNEIVYDDNEEYKLICEELEQKYRGRINIKWAEPVHRKIRPEYKKCYALNQEIHVNSDGNIAPCCNAIHSKERFGNIFDNDNIWNSQFFINTRKLLYSKSPDVPQLCKNCFLLGDNYFKK